MTRGLVLALALALTGTLRAAELPSAPSASRLDRGLLAGVWALSAADAAVTLRHMSQPGGFERNPIARPFVSHGAALGAGYFAAAAVVDWWVPRELRRRGHGRLARAYLVGALAAEAWCVGQSLASARGGRRSPTAVVRGGPIVSGTPPTP